MMLLRRISAALRMNKVSRRLVATHRKGGVRSAISREPFRNQCRGDWQLAVLAYGNDYPTLASPVRDRTAPPRSPYRHPGTRAASPTRRAILNSRPPFGNARTAAR
jgi:hypothetical protein